MMRLLWVTPYLGPTYGGTSTMVRSLAAAIANQGIALDLLSTNANDGQVLEVPLQTWISTDGYRVQYFDCWHRHDLILSSALGKWLNHHLHHYDLVHTHTVFSPLMTQINRCCRRLGIPYVMTPHGMLEPWALSYKAWKKKLYFELFERPNLQQASTIQGLAQPEIDNLKTLGFGQTALIPNGIHAQDFEPLHNPQPFYHAFPHLLEQQLILFLGRLDPKKGLDLLADAFAQVHRHYPQSHLVIVGPDSIGFRPTAEQFFEQAGCAEAVTFTGMLTGPLKYAALAAADVYVAPSYSEGFSLSVLEAMASGLACVITTGCNFPEASDVAHIVAPHSEAIGQALVHCLQEPTPAQAMGYAARQFILNHYTWDKIAASLINVYQAILGPAPCASPDSTHR